MKKTLLASAAIAALMTISPSGTRAGTVALQFSAVSAEDSPFAASAGWSFTTSEKISVTALDAFDPTGAGAGTVRLYDAKGGVVTVLASAKVTKTDPQNGSPIKFFSAALKTPLVLAAGTYFIAEDLSTTTMANGNVMGLKTSSPSVIKWDGEVAAMGQGLDPTTDATGGMFSPGIFGPNFEVGAVGAAIPEPATWAMMLLGFGLLGLGGARLSRRGRSRSIGLGDTA
jgi:PEP-CTERM motif